MLDQTIQWGIEGASLFDLPIFDRFACGLEFDDFECMRWDESQFARTTRGVSTAAGPLDQSGGSFGRSDLDHLVDRSEVDAKVQAAGAHDGD